MTVPDFIAKWRKVELKERSAAQEHFLDLCRTFDHPTPAEADPTGEKFCFERGAAKHGGGDGFADVWKRGFFGWEYKGRHKDLDAAYDQLLRYRNALENPPLLVLCDLDRIIIHTNFTGTVSATFEIPLEALAEPRNIEIMRAVFHKPETLRPGRTSVAVTQDAARRFADIAAALRERGLDPAAVAHFLDRIVFCLFAEDTGLLPDMVFSRIVETSGGDPARFGKLLGQLFETMASGGDFGLEPIRHFNGNLFDDPPSPGGYGGTGCAVLDLTPADIKRIAATAALDWSAVDPSIFGTLFERGLDPAKRSQLGAHFTSKDDIELVVDAVVMAPLRREWEETKAIIESLLTTGRKTPGSAGIPPAAHGTNVSQRLDEAAGTAALPGAGTEKRPAKPLSPAQLRKARSEADTILHHFLVRLRAVKILDPACGSGNFLYVALLRLKDLEREAAVTFPSEHGLASYLPGVGPWQLYGIELNGYAHDLAQMTVWIGWLQWIRVNGFGFPAEPILRPLSKNIRQMDAILAGSAGVPPAFERVDDSPGSKTAAGTAALPGECGADALRGGMPEEPEWPAVDFIIGNPPFLGDKLMRRELGDDYVDRLRALYADRIPGQSDLCCYWFEKARAHIAEGKCKRAGLLATQGIRGGANREVLKRIKESGDIFWAESDRPWILDGANVHVSMVAFDNGDDTIRILDGKPVPTINPNLTGTADVTQSRPLHAESRLSFQGPVRVGRFDIDYQTAIMMMNRPNPHGLPCSDVIRPLRNGMDITKRPREAFVIDFDGRAEAESARYEAPFERLKQFVKPYREQNRDPQRRALWWLHGRAGTDIRAATTLIDRVIATPQVSKHRLFVWIAPNTCPESTVIVIARSDDDFFAGVLHSRIHRNMGTRNKEPSCVRRKVDSATPPPPALRRSLSLGARASRPHSSEWKIRRARRLRPRWPRSQEEEMPRFQSMPRFPPPPRN
jgi:hypothetical protein